MMAYLANAMEALALTKLVFHLPRTLFGLLQAAHSIGLLTVSEVDVAKIVVCTIEIFQQLALPLEQNREIKIELCESFSSSGKHQSLLTLQ